MAIDFEVTPFLFSIGTKFANKIDRHYYHNVHYVWCTTHFDDKTQPATSNPQSICKRLLEQITSGDRHTKEIDDNKAGILRGAQAKFNAKIIDKKQYKEIGQLVNLARYEDFMPVLYIIDGRKVGEVRCEEVAKKDKASDHSIEYRIRDLAEGEYELISFDKLLCDFIEIVDEKAGK